MPDDQREFKAEAAKYDAKLEAELKIPPIMSFAEFLATFKTPDYIIEGIIQRGRLYALTSPTGHGKTAVMQYGGIQIAAGWNIGNIKVTQGPVIFLAGENPDDLCCRMHAACQFHGIDDTEQFPLHVMAGNFPLTEEAAQELKKRIDASGIKPVAIIFDTAASFFPGDDDNANVPMGAYARNLRVLTTCEGNPAVIAPAHPIKSPDRDNLLPRGGGAFLNELDGNLTLWSDAMGEHTTLHWQGKLRGADFQPVNFGLHQVKIQKLLDQRGWPIVSVVASIQTTDQAEAAEKAIQADEDNVLELMRRHKGISQRDIATNAGWVNDKGVPNNAKVHRLLKALQRDKLVKMYRGKWCLTDAGKRETEAE
jgi:RecA-family ATPase